MAYVLVKYFHIVSILVLMASLAIEHTLLKPSLAPADLRRLAITDMVYGIAAITVLVAGLGLWFAVGKDAAFYTGNPVFHAKVGLFILVGLLSIYPTVFFIRNRRSQAPVIVLPKAIIMLVRVELLLMLVIPLLAVLMAQGYGLK